MTMTANDPHQWTPARLSVVLAEVATTDDAAKSFSVQSFFGSIDIRSAPDFAASLDQLMSECSDGVVLDLSRLQFFGTAGLSLLGDFARDAGRRDLAFGVIADRVAARPIEASGLGALVPLYESLDDARKNLCGN